MLQPNTWTPGVWWNAGDLEADASGASPRAGQLGGVAGLAGAALPCSRLSGQQLGEVLDSLRELSSIHMNLSLLYSSGVLSFVDSLKHSPVSGLSITAWVDELTCRSVRLPSSMLPSWPSSSVSFPHS